MADDEKGHGFDEKRDLFLLHISLLLKQIDVMYLSGPIFLTFKSLKDEWNLGPLKTIPNLQCTKAANLRKTTV